MSPLGDEDTCWTFDDTRAVRADQSLSSVVLLVVVPEHVSCDSPSQSLMIRY